MSMQGVGAWMPSCHIRTAPLSARTPPASSIYGWKASLQPAVLDVSNCRITASTCLALHARPWEVVTAACRCQMLSVDWATAVEAYMLLGALEL